MTIPTFTGLNTALSGLEASQAAIDTTGQNITNADTPGYSEETVTTGESGALTIEGLTGTGAGVQLGTGVDVDSISRVRDSFLDTQYRYQNGLTSNANTLATQLAQAQTAVNEPSSDGISEQLSNFWQSWSSLAQNPTSAAAQQVVVGDGQSLASTFNQVDSQLSTVQSQSQTQYNTLMAAGGEVQTDAAQIASLNGQIVSATEAGQSPNALLDQRDQLLDTLSGLATTTVANNSDGSVTVSFAGAATPLVQGTTVTMPAAASLTSAAGGQLGALLSLSSSTGPIGTMMSSLDSVASQVISSVNSLQSATSPFFSGTSASTIAVAATPSTVQASSATGTGDLATQIAALQGGAADQAYDAFVAQVGDTVSSANSTQATAQSVLSGISNQRESVSGVSLDEEMTNLINYQQSYEASARMMSTMQSVISDLIQTVGGAGV